MRAILKRKGTTEGARPFESGHAFSTPDAVGPQRRRTTKQTESVRRVRLNCRFEDAALFSTAHQKHKRCDVKQVRVLRRKPLVKLTRLRHDVKRRPVQHLTVHISPERSRLLMDVSIDAVNTLASGSIFHDLGPEPSKS
jgi:hypothetical protein